MVHFIKIVLIQNVQKDTYMSVYLFNKKKCIIQLLFLSDLRNKSCHILLWRLQMILY